MTWLYLLILSCLFTIRQSQSPAMFMVTLPQPSRRMRYLDFVELSQTVQEDSGFLMAQNSRVVALFLHYLGLEFEVKTLCLCVDFAPFFYVHTKPGGG